MCIRDRITAAFILVQHSIEFVRIVGGGFYDFAILKGEANIFISKALKYRRRVVGDDAVCRIPYRRSVNLAIGNIAFSVSFNGRNILDGEGEVRAWADDVYLVCFVHEFD